MARRSPSAAVWMVALPALGEQFLATAVTLSDFYLAGQINRQAVAAVGLVSLVSWLVGTLFSMVGAGAVAVVSRAVGAGDPALVSASTAQAVRLGGVWSLAIAVGVVAASPLMGFVVDLPPDDFAFAQTLLCVQALAFVPIGLTMIGGSCLKGAGDTRSTLQVMVVVNVLNLMGSWLLAFVLCWGAFGIIWGTVAAWVVGAVLMLRQLHVTLRPRLLSGWDFALCWRLLRVGGPASFDGLLQWSAQAAFMAIVTRIPHVDPTVAYAAHMVAVSIESLTYLPAMAFSIAASALVGQALGAGDPRLARRLGLWCAAQATLIALVMAALYLAFPGPLMRAFSNDPQVVELGAPVLRLASLFQVHLIWLLVFLGALRGAGYVRMPIIITLVGMYGIRLPGAWLLAIWGGWGLMGIWIAMGADLVLRGTWLAERFLRGRWAEAKV